MKEDFLHYVWKYQKFRNTYLQTTHQEAILVETVGTHNEHAGPDFFASKLRIGAQKWAGNVEIHLKSSDWYAHNHEKDPAYDNVILHVVWEHDVEVFRKDSTVVPTLELKNLVAPSVHQNYSSLLEKSSEKWINCDSQIAEVPDFLISNWKERLYFERLEQKSIHILELLQKNNNDWEAVLFQLLAKNFGLVVNGDAFLSVANSLDFATVRKCSTDVENLEALFFGQAGLLEKEIEEPYFLKLKKDYVYQKHKYQLDNSGVLPIQFFRLRPPNFPTIRLSQLVNLYHKNHQLFSELMELKTVDAYYKLFDVATSTFWETHYTFEKTTTKRVKKLTRSFIDLLLINTIIPLRFCYAKHLGKHPEETVVEFIETIGVEKNSIINKFNDLGVQSVSAMDTQALLQLKKKYCDTNGCLRCAIGNHLLLQE